MFGLIMDMMSLFIIFKGFVRWGGVGELGIRSLFKLVRL